MIIESFRYPAAVAGIDLSNQELAGFVEACCNCRRHSSRGITGYCAVEDRHLALAIRATNLSVPIVLDRIGAALQPSLAEFGLIKMRVCSVMSVRLVERAAA